MGLDFVVYAKKKNAELNEDGYVKNEKDLIELAYGRKSWELVGYLFPDTNLSDGTVFYPVNNWRWGNLHADLMKLQDQSGGTFEEISDAYEQADIFYEAPELLEDKYKRLIYKFEHFYDKLFNDSPTLGYDFALGYLISFRDANDNYNKYREDPEYEIVAIISY